MPDPEFTSILLVDDHPVFRDGLRHIVQQQFPSAEITEADSAGKMAAAIDRHGTFDLILLDLVFPGSEAEKSVAALRNNHPLSSIVGISMKNGPATVQAAMAAGANAFISKATPPASLISGLCRVAAGELVVLADEASAPEGTQSPSPRQLDVLRLIVKGFSNKEIATALNISYFTVRVHVSNMLRQWELPSRTSLATHALEQGWI